MAFSRNLSFFNRVASRALSTASSPASLSIHVWHSGVMPAVTGQEFQRLSQKDLLSVPGIDTIKIPHAAVELKIDLNHPDISSNMEDVMRCIMVESEKNILNEEGVALSMDMQSEMLTRHKNKPIHSMNAYLSLYPKIGAPRHGSVVRKIGELENSTKPNSEPWATFLFGKFSPELVSRESDFTPQKEEIRETVTLYHLNYEAILQDLSKFILFKCHEDGCITIDGAAKGMRYYMLDLLRDHAATDEIPNMSPEHVCSTVISRVLQKGLGASSYASAVSIAKQKVGHGFALPDLVIEVAKAAKEVENDSTHVHRNSPGIS